MASAIAALVVDLDDTLTDTGPLERAVWERTVVLVRERFPAVDADAMRRRYTRSLEPIYARFLDGELDERGYRRARLADALAPWGVPDEELVDAYVGVKARLVEDVALREGALELLRAARAAGLATAILTNGPSSWQRAKLARLGLEGEVDAIAISGEIGHAKPDGRAFAAALAPLGVPAGAAVMVGDSLRNDVRGALGAGLRAAVWLAPEAGVLQLAVLPRRARHAATLEAARHFVVPAHLG